MGINGGMSGVHAEEYMKHTQDPLSPRLLSGCTFETLDGVPHLLFPC